MDTDSLYIKNGYVNLLKGIAESKERTVPAGKALDCDIAIVND